MMKRKIQQLKNDNESKKSKTEKKDEHKLVNKFRYDVLYPDYQLKSILNPLMDNFQYPDSKFIKENYFLLYGSKEKLRKSIHLDGKFENLEDFPDSIPTLLDEIFELFNGCAENEKNPLADPLIQNVIRRTSRGSNMYIGCIIRLHFLDSRIDPFYFFADLVGFKYIKCTIETLYIT